MRPVYDGIDSNYPRLVSDRAATYRPTSEYPEVFAPMGSIPEAGETFALWESSYPLMNEFGVAIGESTTSGKEALANQARGYPDPASNGTADGRALFCIAQLMALALERCKDAVCAIRTMGQAAQEHGFYGEEYGSPEAATVIDPTQAWIFEVHGDGANGAVWVAQRVPEGHVAVVSNTMVVKEVLDSPDFLYSDNLHAVAEQHGLWSPAVGRPLNWQLDIGKPIALPRYSSLRTWRVFSRVAPSLGLQPVEDPSDLPFSVPVDAPVALADVFELFGDHYEGTEFDMTQGALAGMNGNPNYELSGAAMKSVEGGGQIPRAISLHRTSYTMIASAKQPFPAVWMGLDAPATSVWVPFYAAALRGDTAGTFSPRYGTPEGPRLQVFDRESAFWAFDFVANWMGLNYRNMSQEMVLPQRAALQRWVLQRALEAEREAAQAPPNGVGSGAAAAPPSVLGRVQTDIQEHVAKEWWKLADELIVRYNDGYYNFNDGKRRGVGKSLPLPQPAWFLKMIGFSQDFYRPTEHWVQPALKEAYVQATDGLSSAALVVPPLATSALASAPASLLLLGLGLALGAFAGQRYERRAAAMFRKKVGEGSYSALP